MTPNARKLLHAQLDQAISLGAAATIHIHPQDQLDSQAIRGIVLSSIANGILVEPAENNVSFTYPGPPRPGVHNPVRVVVFDSDTSGRVHSHGTNMRRSSAHQWDVV